MPDFPPLDAVRACFPALSQPIVFLENAGGSQVPAVVARRMHDYMTSTYVQLGADYALSRHCTDLVHAAHDFVRLLVNGDGVGDVVLGPSSSALLRMLADAYAEVLDGGDEVVVAQAGHEANIGPWLRLERRGIRTRTWRVDPATGASSLADLEAVLSDRTRIVAVPHVSNLLGEILDVEAVVRRAHAVGARVVVDGVAYAPHRAIDVARWGVDWYVYSTYKVYGPHMGALFGRHEAFAGVPGPNHFFVPEGDVPYKYELGGVSHEGCAGLLALGAYLGFLAGTQRLDRQAVEVAFQRMALFEHAPTERLVTWLREHPRVRIVGPRDVGPHRVGTVSFVHDRLASRDVALAACERDIAVRSGHMYAHRLCEALGLDPEDGVVRVSLVHYNTVEEIERLIEAVEPLL